eukprot:m.8625 g.8625  ORF g.8625 m.8625 type:complete len:539 (+) comp5259_c0_seq1:3-1619(+)
MEADQGHAVQSQGEKKAARTQGQRKLDPPLLPSGLKKRIAEHTREAPHVKLGSIKDKKLKANLMKSDLVAQKAAEDAASSHVLLPEQAGYLVAEGMERTFKFTQEQIAEHVDVASAQKIFHLDLKTFGPYSLDYTPNGRHLVLGGRRGHVAAFDWETKALHCELHLKETVRDVQWLHNDTLFAVAQRRHVFIYDNGGTEIHSLSSHVDPLKLEFLRHHFLLVSTSNNGSLVYQDVSTGTLVAHHRTHLGPCRVLKQNPYNAVCHLGHGNGTVTLWSPNSAKALVTQLCHRGPILDLDVDASGTYMATSGLDGQMKVWDIRQFKDEPLQQYFTYTPATTLSLSQRGMLCAAFGPHVQIWKDALKTKQRAPYLTHLLPGAAVQSCRFVPFEDVLGIGHSEGFASILVPGAGEPNIDTRVANPFETTKQRAETEVRSLLDKIPPELISLDPFAILKVNHARSGAAADENPRGKRAEPGQEKNKMRGKNTSSKRAQRKSIGIEGEQRDLLRARLEKEAEAKRAKKEKESATRSILDRFLPKE